MCFILNFKFLNFIRLHSLFDYPNSSPFCITELFHPILLPFYNVLLFLSPVIYIIFTEIMNSCLCCNQPYGFICKDFFSCLGNDTELFFVWTNSSFPMVSSFTCCPNRSHHPKVQLPPFGIPPAISWSSSLTCCTKFQNLCSLLGAFPCCLHLLNGQCQSGFISFLTKLNFLPFRILLNFVSCPVIDLCFNNKCNGWLTVSTWDV